MRGTASRGSGGDVLSFARPAVECFSPPQRASSFREAKSSHASFFRHQPPRTRVFLTKQRASPFATAWRTTGKSQQSINSDTSMHEIVAINRKGTNDTPVASLSTSNMTAETVFKTTAVLHSHFRAYSSCRTCTQKRFSRPHVK